MVLDLATRMSDALRLTRAGRLAEATALLQSRPQQPKSPGVSEGLDRESEGAAFQSPELIDMVPPRSSRLRSVDGTWR